MYYNLRVIADNEVLSCVASDRKGALHDFGEKLSASLTLNDTGKPAPYLLGETDQNLHWVKTDIPVYTTD
ncbi:hypothetical protein GR210_28690 [Rhizobium leguminosarum]|uniref:hypothetical protein n=1 Tax=Rhizobium leguminosarum TaxID=384 RepID=UPI0013DCB72C|nr:hypothetical protein [Rhizobium leguminosarum]MBY5314195.1 hypothetical protein [Rhizobium leguminosarum]NEH52757.1 hypothetical protein [Rhizobium leguminosarum]